MGRVKLTGLSSAEPCLTLIAVYLPSTDYPLDAYKEYLTELKRTINALQQHGPVMIMGDFNAPLKSLADTRQNKQGNLYRISFTETIPVTFPHPAATPRVHTPRYTFSTTSQTIVYYCIVNASLVSFIKDCTILGYHLSLSASLLWEVA